MVAHVSWNVSNVLKRKFAETEMCMSKETKYVKKIVELWLYLDMCCWS